MSTTNSIGPLLLRVAAAMKKALADFKANKPRKPAKPISSDNAVAELEQIEAIVVRLKAWLTANPGALTATDDLLLAARASGLSFAGPAQTIVDGAPVDVSMADEWLPYILGMLKATKAAPMGITGDSRGFGRGI